MILIVILLDIIVVGLFIVMCVRGAARVTHLGKAEIDAIKHFFGNIYNNVSNRFNNTEVTSDGPERSVGVLQAHDFSRVENDNFRGTDRDPIDLAEHDRRRESGEIDVDQNW